MDLFQQKEILVQIEISAYRILVGVGASGIIEYWSSFRSRSSLYNFSCSVVIFLIFALSRALADLINLSSSSKGEEGTGTGTWSANPLKKYYNRAARFMYM